MERRLHVKLDELTPRLMDKFYQSLLKVKTKVVQNKKPKNEYLTVHTVREIHKFLRSAFNQAVKWELMTRNPVLNATLPKEEHQKREIWTAETLMHALEVCDDDILALAMRGIEDMVEQNDNSFDGVINNVKAEPAAGSPEIVPDDKKSVLEKLREQSGQIPVPVPEPERKPVPGCCFEREITGW